MRHMRFLLKWIALDTVVFCCALSGCMLGPDYHSPAPPMTKQYTKSASPVKTAHVAISGTSGKSQRFFYDQDIPQDWWALFHSKELNRLIEAGLINSPTIAAAKAALMQAKETYNAQVGATLYPAVTGQLTAERQRFSEDTIGLNTSALFNLYNASVNVSYTLDIFGGLRREIESLQAQVDYQKFQLRAAHLTLTSNIVTSVMTAASLQAQIDATDALISFQEQQLDIINKQLRAGGASFSDVLSQESQLQQTRASLPPLQQQLAQAQHLLSILVGTLPSEANIPKFKLSQFTLPTNLPVSLPSALVRKRPDIQAQDALLHAACSQVGVATANLFPQLTITGSYGYESLIPSQLFKNRNSVWNIQGGLLQPIFNGGSLLAKRRAAIAAYDEASAQYQQTVLQAFKNVADTLRALQHDAEKFKAQRQAEIASYESLKITEKQYRLGGVSYLSLLTAEKQYQQAYIASIQAEAARYSDTAALFQALGGGWWDTKA